MPASCARRLAVLCVCVLSPIALTGCDNWNSDNRRDSRSLTRDSSTTDRSASDRSAREQAARDQAARDQRGMNDANARTTASGEEQRVLSLLQAKNAEEIDIGQLAQTRAQSREARALADRLVEDHSRSQLQIRDMASRMNMTILDAQQVMPSPAPESDRSTTTPLARLRALNGAEFDRAFAQMMTEGHADLIAKVQSARQNVRNPQIAEFLDRQLKALQTHEQMARAIRN